MGEWPKRLEIRMGEWPKRLENRMGEWLKGSRTGRGVALHLAMKLLSAIMTKPLSIKWVIPV